jgi:hypothetical protein
MTDDNDQEQRRTPPPPRRKASAKRTPPPRRGDNDNGHDADAPPAWASGLIDRFDRVERRLDQVEAGGMRTIPMEAEPLADQRAVNPESMDPFTRRLWEERTHDTPDNYGGDQEPAYNIPLRTYLKNDGSYAELQGDAKSRLYYISKGYHCLTDAELAEYRKLQPSIVAAQRGKANAYNAIVQLINTDPALVGYKNDNEFIGELDLLTEEQLRRETWPRLNQEAGHPDRPLPPPKRFRSEGRDHMLDGIETTPPRADRAVLESLDQGASPPRHRLVEVTPQNANSFR